MSVNNTFHYNIATEGVNSNDPNNLAVLGFYKIIEITIEEVGGRGGIVDSTRASIPKYRVYVRVTMQDKWWEREYLVDKEKKVNVFAKLINIITHAITAKAFAFLKKVRKPNVNVQANIINKEDK